MSFAPASTEQLKREIGLGALEESEMIDLLQKEKKLKKELKDLQSMISERKDTLAEILNDNDITDLPLGTGGAYTVNAIKPATRVKVMSATNIKKKYPHLVVEYPDLITEYTVKGYLKITTNK